MNWALAKPRALELLPHVACFGVVCMLSACARHFLAEMLELAAARLSEVLGTWRTEVVVATVGSAWVVSRTRSLPFVTGLQRQMLQLLVAGGSLQALGKAQAADASSKQACLDPRVVGTAVESLGQDHGCAELIQQLIPEDYLLQFGAALGEEPSQAALVRRALPGAWGQPGSVFGMPDNGHDPDQAWEHILEESTSTLAYWAWRKPHRAGLYAYRTHVVMEGITAPQLRDFNLNDAARFTWDESMLEIEKLPLPTGSHGESKLAQYRAKFPRPMAARDYIYGRRVWGRPSDGGCYVVNVGLDLPGVLPPGRSVPVKDYISLSVVRACASCKGYPEGAAEVITMYFEDPGVRAGIMNIAIRKGLWAFVQKHEAGLREYLAAKQARAERLVRRKSLGGRGSPRAGGRSEPASSIPSSSEYDSETGSEDASYTHSHYAHQRSHHGRRRRRLIPGIRPRKLLLSSLGMVGKVVSSVLFLESGRNEYYYGSDV
ncbi:hypothetical protein WJX72_001542 [[Myrmecia] bisecta]|uniref:START domain-containing protein n=1 Tax=[Myrmecia] bisecta TaxID=41462 RepID=A0AAW1PAN6_9CHLO